MDARELRIGNWLNRKVAPGLCRPDELIPFQVELISEWNIINEGRHGPGDPGIDCKDIDPIPLTPEIIEVWCNGAKSKFYNNWLLDEFFSIQFKEDKWFVSNDESSAGCYVLRDIKYLHQLQNIYFALEDKELEIKIPVTV